MTNSLVSKILLGVSAIILVIFFYSKLFNKNEKISLEEQTIIKEQTISEELDGVAEYESNAETKKKK